jgi:hypothetical protein
MPPYKSRKVAELPRTVLLLALLLIAGPAYGGLDLVPLGTAKPGHEAEWDRLMEVLYQGGKLSKDQVDRLHSISSTPAGGGEGLPKYSNGGMYGGLDGTSFRGSFLSQCEGLLGSNLLDRAWTLVMRPADAVSYGKQLLAIAGRAARGEIIPPFPQKKNVWVGGDKPIQESDVTVEEQIGILRAAGAWYVYWGERGHPIHGWW